MNTVNRIPEAVVVGLQPKLRHRSGQSRRKQINGAIQARFEPLSAPCLEPDRGPETFKLATKHVHAIAGVEEPNEPPVPLGYGRSIAVGIPSVPDINRSRPGAPIGGFYDS
jgi:hypothetical protein